MSIQNALRDLKKFSNDILTLMPPIKEASANIFEDKFKIKLPQDYKYLLTVHNGVELLGTKIYGIETDDVRYGLEQCYLFEHFEVARKMPLSLIPFSPDGGGNHYCFDTESASCPIVFWQHDYPYSIDDRPEITHKNLADWIHEVMIEWTLEDYDYDGTEKA